MNVVFYGLAARNARNGGSMELSRLSGAQRSALDDQILLAVHNHAERLAHRNIIVKAVSRKSTAALMDLDSEKKRSILAQLEKMSALAFQDSAGTPEIETPNEHPEKSLVERSLKFYELELHDQEFWKLIKFDDVIELYNEDGNQVFRTFNFFNTCGYSLLDLLTQEWYVLWERPKFVLKSMFESVNKIFSGEYKVSSQINIPQHVIKEIFNGADSLDFVPRSVLIKFGVICPVFKSGGRVGGFLVSSSAKLQTIGAEDTDNVVIL